MTDTGDGDPEGKGNVDRLELSRDEMAGVVDLFGALTRAELDQALSELAFKHGVDPPASEAVAVAIDAYALVEYRPEDHGNGMVDGSDESGDEPLLAPGPAAFPALPEGAADLPHILDIEERTVDREALGRAVEKRFRGEVARTVTQGDRERIERLMDVSYDLEAWGPVELGNLRERLDDALE